MTDILLLRKDGKVDFVHSVKDIKGNKLKKYQLALVPIEEFNSYIPMNVEVLIAVEKMTFKMEYQLTLLVAMSYDEIEEAPQETYTVIHKGLDGFLKLYVFIISMIVTYNAIISEGDCYVTLLDFLWFKLTIETGYCKDIIKVERKGDGTFNDHLMQDGFCLSETCYSKFTDYFHVKYIEDNKKLCELSIIINEKSWQYLDISSNKDIVNDGLIAIPLSSVNMYHCMDTRYAKYFKYIKETSIRCNITTYINNMDIPSLPATQHSLSKIFDELGEEVESYDSISCSISGIRELIEYLLFFNINLFIIKNLTERNVGYDFSVICEMNLFKNKRDYDIYGTLGYPIQLSDVFQCLSYIHER